MDTTHKPATKNPLKKLYFWVLHWADTGYGILALILLAFTEPIFVPIPADIMVIALCLGKPKSSIKYGLICALFSVLGGTTAFCLGLAFGPERLVALFNTVALGGKAQLALELYAKYDFWAVAISALTPVPYMLFSWFGGMAQIPISKFVIVSVIFRTMRFGSEALLFYFFGRRAQGIIDKYFNLATIVFIILLIIAVYLVKLLGRLFAG